ncbi:lectin family integral membrane protein [Polychaeton citri CBS 116435]|uniref:Lectin family integral membrane protein n=1 Tax=Polychaeton citri CBS 116435 TaxID=1314669 RepID=A0A9P4URQ6_9PEZI|nr:lectin family integral membrane protein [Polychaeton citri CBS 116435]
MPSRAASRVSTAWLLAAMASAQYLNEQLSFGYKTPLSPNDGTLPGWSVSSENHQPQLLSDRIILTPPVPGNTRGALWAQQPLNSEGGWTADFEFRANGGYDSPSGNVQLWFVKDKNSVGASSVYTVGNYDGLALVIDQYGGRGGGVRGFLNDGTRNFNTHGSLESLAFGHCDYSYRNLGRNSKLTIRTTNGLSVSVDDRECFSSDKISIPAGYYFGVTAATAENPDSFEIFKFVVQTGASSAPPPLQQNQKQQQQPNHLPNAPEILPDSSASEFTSTSQQFSDLHNRLQSLSHQLTSLFGEFESIARKLDTSQAVLTNGIDSLARDKLDVMNRRIEDTHRRVEAIERNVDQVRRDVEGRDYKEHLTALQKTVDGVKGSLSGEFSENLGQAITASAPRMGMFIFVVIAVQIMMAGAYLVYKKRRDSAPKKYL